MERIDFFDHAADVGIIGRGTSLEAAFEAAAEAVFGLMADLSGVHPDTSVEVAFEEADPELALVTWLNSLLARARSKGLILSRFSLQRRGGRWSGEAWGEPWRPGIERGVEVKGATLTMLSVRQTERGWETRCVVDV